MRYEEFEASIRKILGHSSFVSIENGRPRYHWEKESTKGDCLAVDWTTGGVSGGSCWDTGDEDNHHPMSADPEPEFEDLDKILEAMCPNITFMQHKALMRDVVKRQEYSVKEYYGNYTDKAFKYFRIKDLYDYLINKDLIGSPDSIVKKIT